MRNKKYSTIENDIISKDKKSAIIKLNTSPSKNGRLKIIKYYSDTDKTRVDILFAIGIKDGVGPDTYQIISSHGILLATEIVTELPDVSQLVHGQIYIYQDLINKKNYYLYLSNSYRKIREVKEELILQVANTGKTYYLTSTELKDITDFYTKEEIDNIILLLENQTIRNKGFYLTSEDLIKFNPISQIGDWAIVGSIPGEIWKYDETGWIDTKVIGGGPEISIPEISNELGNSEIKTVSQKTITENIDSIKNSRIEYNVLGYYIDGVFYESINYRSTELILIGPNTTITTSGEASGTNIDQIGIYDMNKTYQSKLLNGTHLITESCYIRCSSKITGSIIPSCIINRLSNQESLISSVIDTSVNLESSISEINSTINPWVLFRKGLTYIPTSQLFDKTTVINSHISRSTGNEIIDTDGMTFTSDFIEVHPNTNYSISGRVAYGSAISTLILYTADKTKQKPLNLDGSEMEYFAILTTNGNFRTHSDTAFIRIQCTYQSYGDVNLIMINEGEDAIPHQDYKYNISINPNILKNSDIPTIEYCINNFSSKSNLKGKNIAILGDSSTAVISDPYPPYKKYSNWVQIASEKYEFNFRNYARGGYTWMTRYSDGKFYKCIREEIDLLISESSEFYPDIIFIQCGGNDLIYFPSYSGTIENALISNYNDVDDTLIYGAIRKNIEILKRKFPDAIIACGTVFQRLENGVGGSAEELAIHSKKIFDAMSILTIDSFRESGISSFLECCKPYYVTTPDGLEILNPEIGKASREYPIYNWVEPDGKIVTSDIKSSNAVKRYGLFTYDGTHQSEDGTRKIASYLGNKLNNLI